MYAENCKDHQPTWIYMCFRDGKHLDQNSWDFSDKTYWKNSMCDCCVWPKNVCWNDRSMPLEPSAGSRILFRRKCRWEKSHVCFLKVQLGIYVGCYLQRFPIKKTHTIHQFPIKFLNLNDVFFSINMSFYCLTAVTNSELREMWSLWVAHKLCTMRWQLSEERTIIPRNHTK